jgi:hypothetical protein
MMIVAKPEKPKKWKLVTNHASYYFDFVSNKVSLLVFLDWIKDEVPEGAEDVTIGLENDHYYDDSITWIGLNWKEKVPNTKYVSQMKKYNKQLEKWKEQCRK